MYKRYYDGYTRPGEPKENGEIIVPESLNGVKEKSCQPVSSAGEALGEIAVTNCNDKKGFLNLPCELDDIILIGILLFVLLDKGNDNNDGNDIFTLIILGIILFSDIF